MSNFKFEFDREDDNSMLELPNQPNDDRKEFDDAEDEKRMHASVDQSKSAPISAMVEAGCSSSDTSSSATQAKSEDKNLYLESAPISTMVEVGCSSSGTCASSSETPTKSGDENLYNILSSHTTYSKKYNAQTTEMTIRLKEIEKNPEDCIKKVFDTILENELKDVDEQDKVGIVLNNKSFNKPLFITSRRRNQLTTDVILAETEKVVQSNEDFFLNEPLDVKISTIRLAKGQGRVQYPSMLPFDRFCAMKNRSIVVIKNDKYSPDKLCLPRAIIVGKAFAEKKENTLSEETYKKIRNNMLHQRTAAITLCRDAIPACRENYENIRNFRGDLEDVDKFQQFLRNEYEITVFSGSDRSGKKVLYRGNTQNTQYIDLILEDNHYNVITSLTGAFTYSYYCRKCNKGYSHKYDHRCMGRCKRCSNNTPCEPQADFNEKCMQCNIYFTNSQCFDNHKLAQFENNKSICDVTKYCYNCGQIYTLNKKKTAHKCWYKMCKTCKQYVPKDHLCYIQKLKESSSETDNLLVFFDFEARVENGIHIPNYCVIQNQCDICMSTIKNVEEECRHCGKRQYFIDKDGDALLEEFFDIIGRKSEIFKKVILFAHNGGGYDFQFIAKYMIMKKNWAPKIIKNGSKIMSMEYGNICFKDTLHFFGCKLASLPDMFGIKEEVKGYFPHHFNLPENSTYIGPLPEVKYYGVDYMNAKERKIFEVWYEKNRNLLFNFKEEIQKYCKSDVDILRKATLKFGKMFHELVNVDPLNSSITIASACMQAYRKNFLPKNTVGLMDFKAYHMRDNQSKMALRYLLYLEGKYNVELQSAYRGMEKQFGPYKVDGYYEDFPTSKLENFNKDKDSHDKIPLIIEIHGCLFHGCVNCYSEEQRHTPIGNSTKCFETLHHRYENTKKKIEYLRKLPCKPHVLEVWECEINQQCTRDDSLRKIMTDPDVLIRIESNREAFFGGRTECFRNYYRVKNGEKIKYIDVNSLYPYVNKYGVYPTGHPEIFTGEAAQQCDLNKVVGIAKVKILPPKQLFFPVLPMKMNNKLIFALCFTCASTENKGTCDHVDEQREITGTYTCIEIKEAIQNGYQVKNVYEVWSYNSTQYDKTTHTGGIFAEYIDKFLKIKQASSGFPSEVTTEQEKSEFCKQFYDAEGIVLNPEEVQKNPGMRSLSKLCLNSLWGKFGQRNRLIQTSIIDKTEKLTEVVINPEKEISDVTILKNHKDDNFDIILVSWRLVEECSVDTVFINPVISAYVTAQARLCLFSFLKCLGDKALYCDTDSIIYIYREGDPEIQTGPYLGEMGDEMDTYIREYGSGCYVEEFVCEGPKNYSYLVVDRNGQYVTTVTKVRGFTLNYTSSKKLNFEALKNFVTNENTDPITITEPFKIQRKRHHFDIFTLPMTKKYTHIASKRRCTTNFETLPYGFVDVNNE